MISPAITVNRDYENILGFKVGIGLWKTLRHWASLISRKSILLYFVLGHKHCMVVLEIEVSLSDLPR